MNEGFKAIVGAGVDLTKLIVQLAEKQPVDVLLGQIVKLAEDVPAIKATAAGLGAEFAALSAEANVSDLVDFVALQIGSLGASPKVVSIVGVSANLVIANVSGVLKLVKAVQS